MGNIYPIWPGNALGYLRRSWRTWLRHEGCEGYSLCRQHNPTKISSLNPAKWSLLSDVIVFLDHSPAFVNTISDLRPLPSGHRVLLVWCLPCCFYWCSVWNNSHIHSHDDATHNTKLQGAPCPLGLRAELHFKIYRNVLMWWVVEIWKKQYKAFCFSRGSCVNSDKYPPVMSLESVWVETQTTPLSNNCSNVDNWLHYSL